MYIFKYILFVLSILTTKWQQQLHSARYKKNSILTLKKKVWYQQHWPCHWHSVILTRILLWRIYKPPLLWLRWTCVPLDISFFICARRTQTRLTVFVRTAFVASPTSREYTTRKMLKTKIKTCYNYVNLRKLWWFMIVFLGALFMFIVYFLGFSARIV